MPLAMEESAFLIKYQYKYDKNEQRAMQSCLARGISYIVQFYSYKIKSGQELRNNDPVAPEFIARIQVDRH